MRKSMLLCLNFRNPLTYIISRRQLNAKEEYQQKLKLIDDLNINKNMLN